MKIIWKRLLSLALCLVMCLTLLPNVALADDDKTVINNVLGYTDMKVPAFGTSVKTGFVFSFTDSSHAIVSLQRWQYSTDGGVNWNYYNGDSYESALYRMRINVRLNSDATASYKFSSDTTIKMNGESWTITSTPTDSAFWAVSPVYDCTGYSVTINTNGHGPNSYSIIVAKDEKITGLEDPEEEGYVFGGWYSDADCTTEFDFDTPIKKEMTLYAKWVKIQPLTFTANEAGSSVTFYYKSGTDVMVSTDNGSTWTAFKSGQSRTMAEVGDTVMFKGNNVTIDTVGFDMEGSIAASGDVTSLTNSVGGDAELTANCYQRMFKNCTSLTSAPNLPSTTLASGCYSYMFKGCTNLLQAPEIAATTLVDNCCYCMFEDCSSLVIAPELPAKTLASRCYEYMFRDCTSLSVIPKIPATTLADNCCESMFAGCTSLIDPPVLDATTMAFQCYANMFAGCTSLEVYTESAPEHSRAYRIPGTGTGTDDRNGLVSMFKDTAGDNIGTPVINTTYYLREEPYTVKFNTQGYGGDSWSQLVYGGQKVTEPTAPSEAGWTFGGWYTDAACKIKYDFNKTITGDIELYARWIKYYTVKFETNGYEGDPVEDQVIVSGETVTKPEDLVEPTVWHDGSPLWEFGGWYSDEDLTTPYDFDTPVTQDMTLYAKWNVILQVLDFYTDTTSVKSGDLPSFTIKEIKCLHQGYTKNAVESYETYGTETTWVYRTSDTWKTFGESTPAAVYDGTTHYGLRVCIHLKDPYIVKSEYSYVELNNANTPGNYSEVIEEPWGCYAIIDLGTAESPVPIQTTYTVSFDTQGVGTAPTSQKVVEGGKALEPTPTAEGYSFGGWFTDAACSGKFDFNTTITENITLYALWINTWNVTFNVQGHGTAPETQTVLNNTKAEKPSDPSESGWEFGGWYTDAACTTAFDFSTKITEDTIVYAKWTEKSTDPCADYIDIDRTKWYHEGIDFVISHGLMSNNGYVDGKPKFSPNATVTRAMVAMILYRMAGNSDETVVPYQGTFTDVPEGKWYTAAIEWCAQNGLAEGKGNGKYDPNGNVTRQELALFMMRMAAYQGKSTTGGADLSSYPDAAKVASWAEEAMSWAVGKGLITGNTIKGVDYLSPKDSATRAQLATILMRYVNNIT